MSKRSPLYKNHTLRIVSVTINNCLGCKYVHLKFSQSDNVHVLIYNLIKDVPKDLPAVTPVAQAILLLCTLTYSTEESLNQLPQLKIGKGSVSMSFELIPPDGEEPPADTLDTESEESPLDESPSTSKQAMERLQEREKRKTKKRTSKGKPGQSKGLQVTVQRCFNGHLDPDEVFYKINEGNRKTLSISEFHAKFFVRQQHSDSYLRELQEQCAGNWMRIIQSDGDSYRNIKCSDSPFETFVKLFDRQAMQPTNLLCRLAKSCLHINESVRLTERKFVLDVFNQVRCIFEYITVNEYSVWFLVPCQKEMQQLKKLTIDDFDLTKVKTCIRAAGDDENIFWDSTNHNIKDIIMVAFQLTLATKVNQSVLVLSHMETLSDFVTMQYVTASFMNDVYAKNPSDRKWICHRYVQRIVDMALFLGTIVIIEYPSAFTLLKEGRQLIKCYQEKAKDKSGDVYWDIFEDAVKDDEHSLEFLKDAVAINQHNK